MKISKSVPYSNPILFVERLDIEFYKKLFELDKLKKTGKIMLTLEEIIANSKDTREVKRALAVKMIIQGVSVKDIEDILQVSDSFISFCPLIYAEEGSEGLLLKYHGKKSDLDEESRKEVILFLETKKTFSVEELRDHLEEQYQVVYKSKQSYYDLLKKRRRVKLEKN